MAALLGWFALGGTLVATTQANRLPWLSLGETVFAASTGVAAFGLFTMKSWASRALMVVSFAAIPLVAGMVAQFPATLKGDAWLSGLGALLIWLPIWLAAAKRVQREHE